MKKVLLTAVIASMLILPLGGVALADNQDASRLQAVDYIPGGVPAESSAPESICPALHAVVLAMLNQESTYFDCSNPTLAWESLYNMLSLYGQLDDRSEYQGELLALPAETVPDFAAALSEDLSAFREPPASLSDRMTYDAEQDRFLVVCGNDSLTELRLSSEKWIDGALHISGALVYLVDGSDLAQFQTVLAPKDNLFGFTLSSLELL